MACECVYCGAKFTETILDPSCPQCLAFESLIPYEAPPAANGSSVFASDVASSRPRRASTGSLAWDRLLGGGFAIPSATVVYGEAGSMKTTRIARLADAIAVARRGEALYLSAEMPAEHVKMLAERDGTPLRRTRLWYGSKLDEAVHEVASVDPVVVVWDSLQEFGYGSEWGNNSAYGATMRAALALRGDLRHIAILISQVNAEGTPLGPHSMIHMADAVVRMTPEEISVPRKNRFGDRAAPYAEKL
jgi:predicted ATP-dependent serine protease